MLNGIGGRTVEEAKARMTYDEFLDWCAYLKKRGSIHTGTRLEQGFALLATVISRSFGGRANVDDFMPHAEQEPASIDEVFGMLKLKSGGNRHGNA